MPPKFRGNSDDWLDDEMSQGQVKAKPKKKAGPAARSVDLAWEDANARVVEVFPNQCRVRFNDESGEILCHYRRAGVVGKSKESVRERTPVAVGDRVLVQKTGTDTGVVEGICGRKNRLSRPAPGRDGTQVEHVLAANIDLVVIVASLQMPEFSHGLVDRFLVASELEKISPVICITKTDLKSAERGWEIYRDLGYPVFLVSSKTGEGISEFQKALSEKTAVFCGHSGVGKTSLLRKILGSAIGQVGNVNEFTGKGRHTTTGAVLFHAADQTDWIDTPGVREFGLNSATPENLAECFPEFRNLSCETRSCIHRDEPGCVAQGLPRYDSYRRILESLFEV